MESLLYRAMHFFNHDRCADIGRMLIGVKFIAVMGPASIVVVCSLLSLFHIVFFGSFDEYGAESVGLLCLGATLLYAAHYDLEASYRYHGLLTNGLYYLFAPYHWVALKVYVAYTRCAHRTKEVHREVRYAWQDYVVTTWRHRFWLKRVDGATWILPLGPLLATPFVWQATNPLLLVGMILLGCAAVVSDAFWHYNRLVRSID